MLFSPLLFGLFIRIGSTPPAPWEFFSQEEHVVVKVVLCGLQGWLFFQLLEI